jgi:hypothetical protein
LSLQITHVRKASDGDIARLKGSGWEDLIAGVISDIELNRYSYTVNVGGVSADVQVVPATIYRKKHLRTTADTTTRNNLDLLPSF